MSEPAERASAAVEQPLKLPSPSLMGLSLLAWFALALTLAGVVISGYTASIVPWEERWPAAAQEAVWSAEPGVELPAPHDLYLTVGGDFSTVIEGSRAWSVRQWSLGEMKGRAQALACFDAEQGTARLGWPIPSELAVEKLRGAIPAGKGEVTLLWETARGSGYEASGLVVAVAGPEGWRWAPQRLPAEAADFLGMAWRDGETLEVVQRVRGSKAEEKRAQEASGYNVAFDLEVVTLGAAEVRGRRGFSLAPGRRYEVEPEQRGTLLKPEVAYVLTAPREGEEPGFKPSWRVVVSAEVRGVPVDLPRRRFMELSEGGEVQLVSLPACQTRWGLHAPCVFSAASGVLPQEALGEPLARVEVVPEGGYEVVVLEQGQPWLAGALFFQRSRVVYFDEGRADFTELINVTNQKIFKAEDRWMMLRRGEKGEERLMLYDLLAPAEGGRWVGSGQGFGLQAVASIKREEAWRGHVLLGLDSLESIELNAALEPAEVVSLWQHLRSRGYNDAEVRRPGAVFGLLFVVLGGFAWGPLGYALGVWQERRVRKAGLRWRGMALGAGVFLVLLGVGWMVPGQFFWFLDLI